MSDRRTGCSRRRAGCWLAAGCWAGWLAGWLASWLAGSRGDTGRGRRSGVAPDCDCYRRSASGVYIFLQCFEKPDFYELLDLSADPYELHNTSYNASVSIRKALHMRPHQYYPCRGVACP